MSRSSITLSIATWMRSARSGSSLMATMPRCPRGTSPKWIVSGSPSARPSATFIGSTSPMRSATLVSGVASFSTYRSSRWRQVIGRSSPSCRRPPSAGRRDRLVRVLADLRPVDHRRPLVEQPDERAQEPRLALARARRAARCRGRRSAPARAAGRPCRRSRGCPATGRGPRGGPRGDWRGSRPGPTCARGRKRGARRPLRQWDASFGRAYVRLRRMHPEFADG